MKLRNNAKDIDGNALPLDFFNEPKEIIKETKKTVTIACNGLKVDILKEYIREP